MDLKQALSTVLTEAEISLMPRSYDRVGDILITAVPDALLAKKTVIGTALLSLHPSLRVVASRSGMHRGEYRVRDLEVIAGEQRLETVHKESGIRLRLDQARVYYSVRLSGERLRIAGQVTPGEHVAVLCSGVGPFPLVIAANSQAGRIIGIEKNPLAHAYAVKNLAVNRKIDNVAFILGDASVIRPEFTTAFDRVITMLPVGHDALLAAAIDMVGPGGVLHHYAMVKAGDIRPVCDRIHTSFALRQKTIKEITTHRSGHCARDLDRVCFTVATE